MVKNYYVAHPSSCLISYNTIFPIVFYHVISTTRSFPSTLNVSCTQIETHTHSLAISFLLQFNFPPSSHPYPENFYFQTQFSNLPLVDTRHFFLFPFALFISFMSSSPSVFPTSPSSLFSLFSTRRIVLLFLRHVGCVFCHAFLSYYNSYMEELRDAGVTLVAVTLGSVEQAKILAERVGWKGEMYTETEGRGGVYEGYVRWKLGKKGKEVITEATNRKVEELEEEGFWSSPHLAGDEKEWAGDIFQLGGVFVMGPGNTCSYSFRSEYAGHMPNMDDVIAAATGVQKNGEPFVHEKTKRWLNFLQKEYHEGNVESISSESDGIKHHSHAIAENEIGNIVKGLAPANANAKTFDFHYKVNLMRAVIIFVIVLILNHYFCFSWSVISLLIVSFLIESLILICLAFQKNKAAVIAEISPKYDVLKSPKNVVSNTTNSSHFPLVDAEDDDVFLKFFTPSQIDELVIEKGLIECDGNEIMGGIAMEALSHFENSADNDLLFSNRKRSNTVSTWTEGHTNEYQVMMCYFRDFLAKPSSFLGRKGPVCPFVPSAIKMNSLYLSVVRGVDQKEQVKKVIQSSLKKFSQLEPSAGKEAMYKSCVIVFPDMNLANAPDCIDGVQKELKPDFVAQGLMLGEFHLLNNTPGLHNPHFFPLRTPYPSLAIRFMAPSDIVFLATDNYAPEIVAQLLESYMARFGERESKELEIATQALSKLKIAGHFKQN